MCMHKNKLKKIKSNPRAGLTLIETLTYIALLSFLLVAALPLLIHLNVSHAKQEMVAFSQSEAVFIDQKIRRLLRVSTVLSPEPGYFSSELILENTDESEFRLMVQNLVLYLENEGSDGQETVLWTSPTTKISNLIFYRSNATNSDNEIGANMLSFDFSVNGQTFGTTSVLLKN